MSQAMLDHAKRLEEVASTHFPGRQRLTGKSSVRFATAEQVNRGLFEVANVPYVGPFNIEILQRRQQAYREGSYNITDPTQRDEYASLLKDAFTQGGNQHQRSAELAAYRTFVMAMAFPAQPFALSAFQTIDLAADELVMMEFPQSPHLNSFAVRSHAFPGLPIIDHWSEQSTVEYLDMAMVSTDRIQYRLYDLQQGNVSAADRIRNQLQIDMDLKIDGFARTEIDAAITTSGLRDTVDLHPSLNVNNVPDVNYIDLKVVHPGSDGFITLPKLKTILAHLVLLNSLGPQRAVSPVAFVLSPQHITDTWEFVDLVSGYEAATPNPLIEDPRNTIPVAARDEIYRTGMMTTAWGFNINWQPNGQLDRGRIYIFMDQPLGWLLTKSSMDRSYNFDDTNSFKHAIDNYGEMFFKKALRFFVPDMWKYRILIVDV